MPTKYPSCLLGVLCFQGTAVTDFLFSHGSLPQRGVYFTVIACFSTLGNWAQSGTNFPILSDIVPPQNRSPLAPTRHRSDTEVTLVLCCEAFAFWCWILCEVKSWRWSAPLRTPLPPSLAPCSWQTWRTPLAMSLGEMRTVAARALLFVLWPVTTLTARKRSSISGHFEVDC